MIRAMMKSGFALVLLAGMPGITSGAAPDVRSYPTRPVRLIVTYAPGGGVDFAARLIAPRLTEALGQQVVVDNRAGGGGIIGTDIAAKAPPDGYTLLMGTSAGLVINPLLHSRLPYHPVRDFDPVSLLVVTTMLLVVNTSVPVNSVKELITYARAQPGKLSYASVGQGSPNHLATELFKVLTKTNMVHVPYKGAGPALTDLLGGQVQLTFNPMAPLLPHVRSGKLRALAVGGAQRSPVMPDTPTVAEAGVPGFEAAPWYGLFAPAKTPAQIVVRLNAQLARILGEPELVQRMVGQGATPHPSTPAELSRFMGADAARTKMVITAAGIKAE